MPEPEFFATPAALRKRLRAAAKAGETELLVGYYKKGSGQPSITWPESVDEALCIGWIDGIRRGLDDERYTIRFTPRKASSIWSAVNIRRAQALIAAGRMQAAGLKAFEARSEQRSRQYSFEQEAAALSSDDERTFRTNKAAWAYWNKQPPGYKKTVSWWVISAKREETRARRLERLIAASAEGERIEFMRPAKKQT